jgi:hypothetical protein
MPNQMLYAYSIFQLIHTLIQHMFLLKYLHKIMDVLKQHQDKFIMSLRKFQTKFIIKTGFQIRFLSFSDMAQITTCYGSTLILNWCNLYN